MTAKGEIQDVGELTMIRAIEVVQHFLLTEYNIDLAEYIHKNPTQTNPN